MTKYTTYECAQHTLGFRVLFPVRNGGGGTSDLTLLSLPPLFTGEGEREGTVVEAGDVDFLVLQARLVGTIGEGEQEGM